MKQRGWAMVGCGLLAVAAGLGCGGGGGGGTSTSFSSFQPASLVVGQPGFTTGEVDRGLPTPAANSVGQPAGVRADGSYLVVADRANNRIWGLHGVLGASDPPADFVVGQADFTSDSSGLAANRLHSPRDLWTDGGRLFVADTGNNRVLIWNTMPLGDQPADLVLGQLTFTSNVQGAGPSGMNGPTAMIVSGGRLLVADSQNNRVLVWNTMPVVNGALADLVLGQPDFTTTTSKTTPTGMEWPRALWSDGNRLVVSDSGNCRVLIWNTFPTANGAPADAVIGQPDFVTKDDKAGPDGFSYLGGVTSDGTRLFVVDEGNRRVLVFNTIPTQSGAVADLVLGQSDFAHTEMNDDDQDGVNDGNPSARTLYAPEGASLYDGRLYVADFHNSRVVVYVGN